MGNWYLKREELNNLPFQQGLIFNHAVAEKYAGDNVYGIIITPRCDIQNKKVPMVHYLPLIPLEEWVRVEISDMIAKEYLVDIRSKAISELKNANIAESVLSTFSERQFHGSERIKARTIKFSKTTIQFDDFLCVLHCLENHKGLEPYFSLPLVRTMSKMVLHNLAQGKYAQHYPLPSWDDITQYPAYVVSLREVRHIQFPYAEEIVKGIDLERLALDAYFRGDINTSSNDLLVPIQQLQSPFLEHMMERFHYNFCRIGIEDVPLNADYIDSVLNTAHEP